MSDQGTGATGELRELFRVLWRRKGITLLVFSLVMAGVIGLTAREAKRYESSAQVVVGLTDAEIRNTGVESRLEYERDVANELDFIRSDEIQQAMFESLGFVPRLEVTATDGDAFIFTVSGTDRSQLADVANGAADVYVSERADRILGEFIEVISSVERQVALLDEEELEITGPIDAFRDSFDPFEVDDDGELVHTEITIARFEEELRQLENDAAARLGLLNASKSQLRQTQDELRLSASLQSSASRVSRRAMVPTNPVSPNWLTNMILGALAAAICGLGAALVLDYLDRRITTLDDVRTYAGDDMPLLGLPTAPRVKKPDRNGDSQHELVLDADPDSDAAQALWELNGLIVSAKRDVPEDEDATGSRVIVTSAEPVAGKTFVAANLAQTSARSGQDTLLVDVDLRRPRIHRMFGLENKNGVSEASATGSPVVAESVEDNLHVEVAGRLRGNPVELASRIEQNEGFRVWDGLDLLVMDAPPVLAAPEAMIWASMCDTVLFVVRAGRTTRQDFVTALERIEALDASVLVVLTDQRSGRSDYKYSSNYRQTETSRWKRLLPSRS